MQCTSLLSFLISIATRNGPHISITFCKIRGEHLSVFCSSHQRVIAEEEIDIRRYFGKQTEQGGDGDRFVLRYSQTLIRSHDLRVVTRKVNEN